MNIAVQERIWLSSPHMGGSEEKYVKQAFDSNWVAPLGPNVNAFEQSLESYLAEGVFVGALSSGTAAIHLGLVLLGVGKGDEVICQSMTFSASANPILYQGSTPIFVDSEPGTWNMCPEALETALKDRIAKGRRPKAVIAVHLYGVPFLYDEIREVCDRYEVPLLEDAAEALGSTYRGRKCGTLGDIGVLSFNGNKIITTSGGGAIVCHTKDQKERAVFFSTQSRDAAPHYQHSEIGYNYRMSNICAGIGCGQMEVLDSHVRARRKMHDFYAQLLADVGGATVFSVPNDYSFANYWLTAITLDASATREGKTREDLRLFLENLTIESRPLWKPMHLQPIFHDAPYYGGTVSEDLFRDGLCLPSGSNLTDADRMRLSEAFNVFFGE